MPWYLEVTTPDLAVAVYELAVGKTFKIGRDRGEIRIHQDVSISSSHVQVMVKEHEILWDDLSSSNGTIHRNRRKASGVLLPGDELLVGKSKLKFDPEAKNMIRR